MANDSKSSEANIIFDELISNFSYSAHDLSSDDDEGCDADEKDLLRVELSCRSDCLGLATSPSPLIQKYWKEPCATSFKVRGGNYIRDRKKKASSPSLFRLFAVDLLKVSKPILSGMCNHPHERVQKCVQAEKEGKSGSQLPPFIFCVNITLPGTPAHHLVMYYAVDDFSLINNDENSDLDGNTDHAFNKLAAPFFFGDSDKYRDSTFKLIPRIVSGNFIVKKAVGSKPTILGQKLKQHYIRDKGVNEATGKPRFLELIVDVGSDAIAKRVVGLSTTYAKTLVTDMAFVLEGKSKSTLPENVMGTVRLTNIDFSIDLRYVEQPDDIAKE